MPFSPSSPEQASPSRAQLWRKLPPDIVALGTGSLFMDMSSELIHSLLPLFMTSVLGAGMAAIGLVEGVAEAAAAFSKVFSGTLSDRFRRRKPLVVLGYGLAALTKPVFPLAASLGWVFTARFFDRVGKGIRGAPRDALVADITPPELRGAAYGLRQSLDSVGAFLGPLLAMACMAWFAGNITAALWVAVPPAFLAMVLFAFAVREPEAGTDAAPRQKKAAFAGMAQLPARYWLVVAAGSVFTLARFSEAFLVLRARDVGLPLAQAPVVMVVMNIVYAATAFPAGAAADRLSRRGLLAAGLVMLTAADLFLAAASAPFQVLLGAALWGLHMGITQGLFAKLVADTAPGELRGAAFGVFNLMSGGALLLASVLAGGLWQRFGAPATFFAGAAFAASAALAILAFRPRGSRATPSP